MSRMSAAIFGFLIASVLPAALFAVFTPLSGTSDLKSIMGTFLVTYYFSAIATVVIGVPTFLLLRHFGIITWWSALCAGFLDGVLLAVIIRLPGWPDVRGLVTFGLMATASAFAFWLIWRRGRDMRTAT